MRKISKWNLLYLALALLLLFSFLAAPRIVTGMMNQTKGRVVTVTAR